MDQQQGQDVHRVSCVFNTSIEVTSLMNQEESESMMMLAEAAKECAVAVVGGSIPEEEKLADGSRRLYNTSYVFNADGELVDFHRKVAMAGGFLHIHIHICMCVFNVFVLIYCKGRGGKRHFEFLPSFQVALLELRQMHLFDIDIPGKIVFKESETLSPGNKVTVCTLPIKTVAGSLYNARVGLAICYDIRFPELAFEMQRQGVEIICAPGAFNMSVYIIIVIRKFFKNVRLSQSYLLPVQDNWSGTLVTVAACKSLGCPVVCSRL